MEPFHFYIHIPFCRQKCLYCDFPSFAGQEAYMEDYTRALLAELKESRAEFSHKTITSIFFGGGTPTVLPVSYFGKILDEVLEHYPVSDDCEITTEANPQTVDRHSLSEYRVMGVNRLSFGLQAWQNRLLQTLGRIHRREAFVENFLTAREVGFSNLSVDLMFALPHQTIGDWEETLREVCRLDTEHLSTYSLIIEPKTPFDRMRQEGKLKEADERLDREMYHAAQYLLEQAGYGQYEISNFAKPGFESRHNLAYWDVEEYAGFGLAAHSYAEGVRYHNTGDLAAYLAAKGRTALLRQDKEVLSEEEKIEEFLFLGLRKTAGISLTTFEEKFHAPLNQFFSRELSYLMEEKLLVMEQDRLRLTPKGMDVSNFVFEKFIFSK